MNLFLGVDGGNTKTVALVATLDGTVVGAGRSGCSDIFGAANEAAALDELERAVTAALAAAGAGFDAIDSAAFCLAGADWPEDHDFLRAAIAERGLARRFTIANDASGALRAGTADGVGVILACGTGGVIGARNAPGKFWHSGFWAEAMGGAELGRLALHAAMRSALAIDPPTQLLPLLTGHFGVADIEALVRLHYGRHIQQPTEIQLSRLAPLVLDAAAGGDDAARSILGAQGRLMADYGRAAARQVGLPLAGAPVVLSGGVFRHRSGLLLEAVRQSLADDGVTLVQSDREPAMGALLLAFEAAELAITPERLETMARSAPDRDFYRTADAAMPAS